LNQIRRILGLEKSSPGKHIKENATNAENITF
jgi:hypothetical protein